jgi:hypothetical protein
MIVLARTSRMVLACCEIKYAEADYLCCNRGDEVATVLPNNVFFYCIFIFPMVGVAFTSYSS